MFNNYLYLQIDLVKTKFYDILIIWVDRIVAIAGDCKFPVLNDNVGSSPTLPTFSSLKF